MSDTLPLPLNTHPRHLQQQVLGEHHHCHCHHHEQGIQVDVQTQTQEQQDEENQREGDEHEVLHYLQTIYTLCTFLFKIYAFHTLLSTLESVLTFPISGIANAVVGGIGIGGVLGFGDSGRNGSGDEYVGSAGVGECRGGGLGKDGFVVGILVVILILQIGILVAVVDMRREVGSLRAQDEDGVEREEGEKEEDVSGW
ncbi:hypothetical protein F5884DRAFT_827537 [Xylogone sp. PMI_703]|nr:hypothetical protein F5884DRAFT_827537 [Xylogone sp. PMI_703]